MLARALLLLLIGAACRVAALDWQQCSDQRTTVERIKRASLEPEPVPAGSAAKFTIEGSSDAGLKQGKVSLDVSYLGVRVYRKIIVLAKPLPVGDFSASFAQKFPSYTPPGSYKLRVQILADEGDPFLCLDAKFKVVWRLPSAEPWGSRKLPS